ncbi:MAG: hypothetical protein AB1679_00130 [Actinomycetota bacterium]
MRRTLSAVARSACAALALLVLLVGVPLALAALVGWPLPTRLPSLHEVGEALGGSTISDEALIKGIAVVCWLAWAQLVASVVVEAYAAARGHAAARLPLGGLLQPLARQLVLTAVVLLPPVRPTLAAPIPIKAVAAVETHPLEWRGLRFDSATTPVTPAPDAAPNNPAVPAPTCIVEPRDSLWRLAERHLGNGYRWREIFQLNEGVRQDDGRSLREPDVIRPGWVLTLPPDVVGMSRPTPVEGSTPAPSPVSPPSPQTPPGTPEVPPATPEVPRATPEVPPATAEAPPTTLEVPAATPEVPPATPEVPPATAEAPPTTLEVPPATAEAPPTTLEVPAATPEVPPATPEVPPATPAVPAPSAGGPLQTPLTFPEGAPAAPDTAAPKESAGTNQGTAEPPAGDSGEDDAEVPVPALARIGLMATGVVITIDRLRRVQQRRRRRGRTIPVPAGSAAEAERGLRAAAAGAPTDRLDVALRSLSAHLATRGAGPTPAIEAVTVSDEAIEILLTEPATAHPGPFVVTAEGRSWTLPTEAEVPAATVERPALAPLLAVIGTADERQVLVDLEARSTTALMGEADAAVGLFAALTLGLATSRWADDLRVVVIGQVPDGLRVLERIRVAATVTEVVDDLEADSRALSTELAASGASSTLEARLATTPDGWVPTVVLVDDPRDPSLARLLQIASEWRGLAVVVLGSPPVPVAREITVTDRTVRVSPPGLNVSPLGITAGQIGAAAEVIDLAASRQEGEATVPLVPEGKRVTEPAAIGHDRIPIPAAVKRQPPEVEVRIIGSPEIAGGKEPIDRRKSKELVVYLALHPRGSDEGRLKAALWPRKAPSSGTFNQTVSKARVSLGRAEDGSHHLPHVADGLYRLGRHVAIDFHRLEAAFAAATTRASDDVIEELAAALSAVRGVPFESGGAGYEWAHTEGLIGRVEAVAADAALLLCEWFLDRRDTARTQWAAAQGLLASPGDERLFRARMQAHDLAGNPAGVESVMEELCHVIEALEPYDELHPETVALYEELRRRGRRTG